MRLRYRKDDGEWQTASLPEGNLMIGRQAGCGLYLPGDLVSRQHAEIRRRGDRAWIVDLGSSNGTRLGGKRLEEQLPQAVLPGQPIEIGDYTLLIDLGEPLPVAAERREPAAAGHVFISYCRRDKELVYPLALKLEASGVQVWIDKQDIRPGAPWRGQIVQAIAEADAFVLLLSPDSCASENVAKELDLAIEYDVLVLPVILQPAEVPTAMKYQLVGIQHINLFNQPEAGFAQLVGSLRERQEYLRAHPKPRPKEMQAELVLPGMKLSEFYQQKQQQLLNFLAQVTSTSPSAFSLASAVAGSVRVIVNMPASAAYELKAQALNGNPALAAAGIGMLRLVGDAHFIQLGGSIPPAGTTGGEPPSQPPSTSPAAGGAATGGSHFLKILLFTLGAIVLVILGIYAGYRLFYTAPTPPPPPPAYITKPPATAKPAAATKTRTSKPELPATHKPTFTKTLRPTATRTKTPTRLPTETRTPTETPFICAPYMVLVQNANCRVGPGTVYDPVTSLLANQNVNIVGKNDNPSIRWWWVQLPNSPARCWISDVTAQTFGQPECVPVIPAPPTPTPTQPPPPPVPQLIEPINNEWVDCYYGNPISFGWTAVSSPLGIDHYEWVIEMADSYGNFSGYASGSTGGTSTVVDISCSADYRWRVRAVDSVGRAGDYSGYGIFNSQ